MFNNSSSSNNSNSSNSSNLNCDNSYSSMLMKQESSSSQQQSCLYNNSNIFMPSQPESSASSAPLYTIVNDNSYNTTSIQQPTTMPRYIQQQPYRSETTSQISPFQPQMNSFSQRNQGLSIQTPSFPSQQSNITELSPSSLNFLASLLNNNTSTSTSTSFLSPPQQQQRFHNVIMPTSTAPRQNFTGSSMREEAWLPQQTNVITMNNNFSNSNVNNVIVNNNTIMSGMYNISKESNSAFFNALQIPPPNIGAASENIVPPNQEQGPSPVSSTGSPSPTETTEKKYTIRFEQDGAKLFVCNECSKGFTRRSDLKTHQRIHSNEKPYLCPFCEKSFTTSSNLRRHERIHTGSKPYQCNTCGKAFSQTSHLKRHKSIHDKQ